jgi:ribosomal protein L37AE/L43A
MSENEDIRIYEMTDETRIRKACPSCLSHSIGKRKKIGNFFCKHCGCQFLTPATKVCKTTNVIPHHLKIIMEKKKETEDSN